MNPQRILLLSASYGSGHVQAANAFVDQFEHMGIDTIHVDILKLLPRLLEHGLRLPYTELAKRSPKLWGIAYNAMRRSWALHRYHRSVSLIAQATKKKLSEAIVDYMPDIIICTHPTTAHLLDVLQTSGIHLPPFYIQITDYGYHPLWKSTHARGYLLPTTDMVPEMLQDGISKSKLYPTGIPVSTTFTTQRAELRRTENAHHYLIMTGGFGLVDPSEMIDMLLQLPHTHTISVITGKNTLLQHTLQKKVASDIRVSVLGWVDDIADRMAAADVVVTKPGGMTTTEALTLGKPIVYYSPLPGQETDNVAYLTRHNLGCSIEKLDTLKNLEPWHEGFTLSKLPFLAMEPMDQD